MSKLIVGWELADIMKIIMMSNITIIMMNAMRKKKMMIVMKMNTMQ